MLEAHCARRARENHSGEPWSVQKAGWWLKPKPRNISPAALVAGDFLFRRSEGKLVGRGGGIGVKRYSPLLDGHSISITVLSATRKILERPDPRLRHTPFCREFMDTENVNIACRSPRGCKADAGELEHATGGLDQHDIGAWTQAFCLVPVRADQ